MMTVTRNPNTNRKDTMKMRVTGKGRLHWSKTDITLILKGRRQFLQKQGKDTTVIKTCAKNALPEQNKGIILVRIYDKKVLKV